MRKRTFGRWATLLAVVAALGVGGFLAGSSTSSGPSGHVIADVSWQLFDVSWQ
jgi:hypothetical protein